ncbi:hypothetical protein L0244_38695 [bacterium]|nr:hypothetical protein [bacterium]
MDQNVALIVLLGAAAYFLFFRKSAGPLYRNMQGQIITEIVCGQSITFEVPGYTRVWLSQLKDGVLNFDGPFDVPMSAYVLNCSTETGVYEIAVYELDANDVKGELIGQTTFRVLPQSPVA